MTLANKPFDVTIMCDRSRANYDGDVLPFNVTEVGRGLAYLEQKTSRSTLPASCGRLRV